MYYIERVNPLVIMRLDVYCKFVDLQLQLRYHDA